MRKDEMKIKDELSVGRYWLWPTSGLQQSIFHTSTMMKVSGERDKLFSLKMMRRRMKEREREEENILITRLEKSGHGEMVISHRFTLYLARSALFLSHFHMKLSILIPKKKGSDSKVEKGAIHLYPFFLFLPWQLVILAKIKCGRNERKEISEWTRQCDGSSVKERER